MKIFKKRKVLRTRGRDKGKVRALLFGFLCLFLLTQTLCAKGDENIPINYAKLTTAQTVTFILEPSMQKMPTDENAFKQSGCNFTTQDSTQIGTLVQILYRAEFRKALSSDVTFIPPKGFNIMAGVGQGLYFTFPDGTEARFLFTGEAVSGAINAQFTHAPAFNNIPLYAYHALPWYLTYWASQIGKPSAKSIEVEQFCNRNINDYLHPRIIYRGP